jgi:DNA-binding transcriptional ArsR family regulator
MRPLVHPPVEAITLQGVLHALAEPTRLVMVRAMVDMAKAANCTTLAPCTMPKSTQSFHFQVLREAGIIHSERRGAEVVNTLRCADLEARFPGLLQSILAAADAENAACDLTQAAPAASG